jgi:antitoxin MazE
MEPAMRIFKLDDSLVVRLPEPLVKEMGLSAGDDVNVTAADHRTIAISRAEQDSEKVDRRVRFLKEMEQFRWPAPEGYKFDRDEANER